MGSVEHSLPTSEPPVRKCICPGGKVPFYCSAHGRVENPNWPLLSRIKSPGDCQRTTTGTKFR